MASPEEERMMDLELSTDVQNVEEMIFYSVTSICKNPENENESILFNAAGAFYSPLSVSKIEEAVDKMMESYERIIGE